MNFVALVVRPIPSTIFLQVWCAKSPPPNIARHKQLLPPGKANVQQRLQEEREDRHLIVGQQASALRAGQC